MMNTSTRETVCKMINTLPSPVRKAAVTALFLNQRRKLIGMKTPLQLQFYVTSRCNLKCTHCFFWRHINSRSRDELSLESITRVVRSLKNSIESVVLTGGEPFLRPDIVEICKAFAEQNRTRKIVIATNGMLSEIIPQRVQRILEETSVDLGLQLSLDGLESTHDTIRGVPGSFGRMRDTLTALRPAMSNRRFNVAINTTLSRRNASEVREVINLVKNELKVFHGLLFMRNAARHSFQVPPRMLSDLDPEDGLLSVEEMEKLACVIGQETHNVHDPLLNAVVKTANEYVLSILKNRKAVLRCRAGRVDGVVYANGDVALCEFTRVFANLMDFDYDFHSLWHSPQAKEARLQIRTCFCAHPCNLIASMRYDWKSLNRLFGASGAVPNGCG